jgi:hypothetical protein
VELRELEPLTSCVQNTTRLSAPVAHLGQPASASPPGSAVVGICCGQDGGQRDSANPALSPRCEPPRAWADCRRGDAEWRILARFGEALLLPIPRITHPVSRPGCRSSTRLTSLRRPGVS